MVEWVLDSGALGGGGEGMILPLSDYPLPCDDCVRWNAAEDGRVIRGDGAVGTSATLEVGTRGSMNAGNVFSTGTGFRCARAAKLPN